MRFHHVAIVLAILLTGCATTQKTEIDVLDPKFSNQAVKNLGIIKFDIHTFKQMGGVGLLEMAVWAAADSMKNSIDEEGVAFYRDLLGLLKGRLGASPFFRFKNLTSDSENDPVALNKQIHDAWFWGSKPPKEKEIIDFTHKHGLDYVLYGLTIGGKTDNIVTDRRRLFMETKWKIYDSAGKETASIFTRSIDEKTLPNRLTDAETVIKFQALFGDNIERFLSPITGSVVK